MQDVSFSTKHPKKIIFSKTKTHFKPVGGNIHVRERERAKAHRSQTAVTFLMKTVNQVRGFGQNMNAVSIMSKPLDTVFASTRKSVFASLQTLF